MKITQHLIMLQGSKMSIKNMDFFLVSRDSCLVMLEAEIVECLFEKLFTAVLAVVGLP